MLVFISYSRHDREFALRLCGQLRAWGHDTWIDIQNIPKGAPWPDEIDKGLEAADAVVGVLSKNSMASGNAKNEWDWALEYDTPLLPVRLEECKVSHRYIRLNFIDCAEDEDTGLALLHEALKAPKTPYRAEQAPDELPAKSVKAIREPRGVDNRARMLQKVYDFWVKGVLEPSTIGDVWLDLPAGQLPEAIQPEIRRDVRNPDFDTFTFGSGVPIGDVFRRLGRELLILGAPGSGKTMTLLELAKDLIAQAQADDSLPVPVVLNLASWAEHHPEKLEDWLVERLFMEYGVPRKLAASWIDNGKLLFLLDGLDEVVLDRRDACVTAINAFWQRYDQVDNGIVVCSRIADYEMLTGRLRLENAIQLQALTPGQADAYLARLGQPWADLRAALPGDPVLRGMGESPLLLNIMAVAYRNTPRDQIVGLSEENQQRQLFKHYVDRRLHEGAEHKKYSHVQTRHYLSWLGRKMVEHSQSVFHIEGLQPTWLDTEPQRRRYRRIIGALTVLFFSLIIGLVFSLVVGFINGIIIGLVSALIAGQAIVLNAGPTFINIVDRLNLSWTQDAREKLIFGLTFGSVISLVLGLGIGLELSLVFGLAAGLVIELLFGLGFGLFGGLKSETVEQRTLPNQGIKSSFRNALLVASSIWLVFGLIIGVIFGLIFGLVTGLIFGLVFGLVTELIFGLFVGMVFGGWAVIQHTILRLFLSREGVTPLNYAEFLQYASSRHLTRQVGGGYVFRHRMLMEYFAQLES